MATVVSHGGNAAADSTCVTSPSGRSLELVYRLQAGEERVTPSTRDEAVAIVCARLRALEMAGGKVSALGERRIRVVLPYRGQAGEKRRAIDQIGATGQLHFFDWEPNLIGRERRIGGHPAPSAPAGPLSRARREWKAAGRDIEKATNRRLILSGAFPTASGAAKLASQAPFETVVVAERPTNNFGAPDPTGRAGWYALKDNPALSGADIVDPRQETDELGSPNVTFGFTDDGREAFEQVTRAIARRGQARADGPVSDRVAERLSGHFAIVFDGEVKTRPIINFAQDPDGIDGRTGAQISGGFTSVQQARDLATILRIGALPIELVLERQRILSR